MRKPPLNHRLLLAVAAAISVSTLAYAQPIPQEELERPPPMPPAPEGDVPIPPKIQDEQIEPTVTIIEEEDRRVEEYRLNGQVYMVKVTPKAGVPYYYVDADGDGKLELDVDRTALDPVQPVYWKIKEWK
ncbi:MAG: DUF2782 domain-containing protein [Xanthomonadales bacterium]|nr:DUF2782 domain-containing protein [Gammaproteobacteria bacterium]MBT8052858.1 DUF2782 domain-containing protein [Gammaproteobacteria bacterium]NND55681.1 DUF2782 domain-containing protein [Xanthomonadales bacterium]NNK49992.1 DUF2782 domain-containing protein [Xanthomonadales bacterium]